MQPNKQAKQINKIQSFPPPSRIELGRMLRIKLYQNKKISTGDAVDFADEGEASRGPIALADPLEEVLDFLLGVDDGVLADVELGRLGAVDLEDAVVLLVAVAADEVESLQGSEKKSN